MYKRQVFGWTGIICTSLGLHVAIAILIALVLGFLAMLGVAKVLQLTRRLTQDGSIDVRRLLGEMCIRDRDASIGVANAYTYPFYYVRYGRQF